MNSGDDLALRRRRAVYRARHRGSKEMDWLLGRFAEAELVAMTGADLDCFEALLAAPDPALERWIKHGGAAGEDAPPAAIAAFVTRIRRWHKLEA